MGWLAQALAPPSALSSPPPTDNLDMAVQGFQCEFSCPAAFITLSKAEAARVQAKEAISPSVFNHAPRNSFFKLFRTQEEAMKAALAGFTHISATAATEDTEWFFGKLYFTQNQWCRLLLSDDEDTPHIVPVTPFPPTRRWRITRQWNVYGELSLRDIKVQWWHATVAPVGYDHWSKLCLNKRPREEGDGAVCADCGEAQSPVWKASKGYMQSHPEQGSKRNSYCAICWNKYVKATFEEPAEEPINDTDEDG